MRQAQGSHVGSTAVVGALPNSWGPGHGLLGAGPKPDHAALSWPLRLFLLSGFGILLAYGVAGSLGSSQGRALANAILPLALGLLCLGCAASLIRRSSLFVLMPFPWFLLTSAAYFGLGPLLFVFGLPETIAQANLFYPVTEETLFRTNALNAVCILTVVATFWASSRLAPMRGVARALRMRAVPERRWLIVFVVVGLGVKLTLTLPYNYGVLPFVPPTSVMVFGTLTSVASLMLSRRVFMGQLKWLPLFLVVAALDIGGGVLQFSKLGVLLAVIFIGIGAYLARPTLVMAASFFLVAVLAYVVLIPLVNFGRRAVGPDADASARGQATVSFVSGRSGGTASQDADTQGWWLRLAYPQVQTFVMDAYDSGVGGTSLQAVPMSLIPRFLWPTKPIVTIGAELTYLINGSSSSQSSPTSFGEGYWNGGWLLALGVAAWMGLVFGFFETVCLGQLAGGNFGVLPFAALGMLMGLRPDDWFGPTYVGGFAISLTVYASCLWYAWLVRGRR
jgi:hypothetical protein